MFRLFQRRKLHSITGLCCDKLTLLSVSEQIKPMSQVEFDMANQSLEELYDWLADKVSTNIGYGGHFNLQQAAKHRLLDTVAALMESASLPVLFANDGESLLHALPMVASQGRELGFIHISRSLDIKPTLEPEKGSLFHFVLQRSQQSRLFCLGVDSDNQDPKLLDYAEDLGCDWLSVNECHFRSRFNVKQQLSHYLSHCDDVVINIDLASLQPVTRLESDTLIEVQMVNRVLRQVLLSGKVRLVQFVGYKDKHIYSKETLGVVNGLASLFPSHHRAA